MEQKDDMQLLFILLRQYVHDDAKFVNEESMSSKSNCRYIT